MEQNSKKTGYTRLFKVKKRRFLFKNHLLYAVGGYLPVVGVFEPEPIGVSDAQELFEDDCGKERSDGVRRRLQKSYGIRVHVLQTVVVHRTQSPYHLHTLCRSESTRTAQTTPRRHLANVSSGQVPVKNPELVYKPE